MGHLIGNGCHFTKSQKREGLLQYSRTSRNLVLALSGVKLFLLDTQKVMLYQTLSEGRPSQDGKKR